jgi:hypothetical protein
VLLLLLVVRLWHQELQSQQQQQHQKIPGHLLS